MIQKIFKDWRWLLPIQISIMLILSLCATLLPLIFPTAYLFLCIVFLWLMPCAFGAWGAFRLTRCGLNCYAAWLLQPVIHTSIPWLIIGYPPHAGSMALCAIISLIGAAAGDVLNKHSR